MTTRCKPGDAAWIRGSDFPENVGRVVKVVGRSKDVHDPSGSVWWECHVEHGFLYGWMQSGFYMIREGVVANILDADLTPITGEPIKEEIHDEVTA